MRSVEYYGVAEDLTVREIERWLKYIADYREACHLVNDKYKSMISSLEAHGSKGISHAVQVPFLGACRVNYAHYLDVWRELDEEESPYRRLCKITDQKHKMLLMRMKFAFRLHEEFEKTAERFREKYRKSLKSEAMVNDSSPKRRFFKLRKSSYFFDRQNTDLETYKLYYTREYKHRSALIKTLNDIKKEWFENEKKNLKTLRDCLKLFIKIIDKVTPGSLREVRARRSCKFLLSDRRIARHIEDMWRRNKKCHRFPIFEGPSSENPVGDDGEYSRFGDVDSDSEYSDDESSFHDLPTVGTKVYDPNDIGRLENVRLVAKQHFKKMTPDQISFREGDVVIQTHTCNIGGVCYGYKVNKFGVKKFGFYPPSVVALPR